MQKVVHGLTQAVDLNWNFKIGAQVNQIIKNVSPPISLEMGNGMMIIATESIVSFVNLSN